MTARPFGAIVRTTATDSADALAQIMREMGDPGPVVHDDGAGRVWTETHVYGLDFAARRVDALPRNPPAVES